MSKTTKPKTKNGLKPVRQIEVSEKNVGLRIVLLIVFVALTIVSIITFINAMGEQDKGWRPIAIDATGEANCADEFSFYYELGRDGKNPTMEYNEIKSVYTQSCISAYRMFSADQPFEGLYNLAFLNANVNHDTVLEAPLYQALQLYQNSQSRVAFMAPLYDMLQPIYNSLSDEQAKTYDPNFTQEVREYFDQILPFAQSADHVWLEIKPQNTVCLHVSNDYLAVCQQLQIEKYFDLAWLRNAFIADYLAEQLTQAGFVNGYLTSVEGYNRSLGGDIQTSLNVFSKFGTELAYAATVDSSSFQSAVVFKNYKTKITDQLYVYADGSVVSPFLDANGNSVAAVPSLTAYSKNKSCAAVALSASSVYLSSSLSQEQIKALAADGVYAVWCEEETISYTEESIGFVDAGTNNQHTFIKTYIH